MSIVDGAVFVRPQNVSEWSTFEQTLHAAWHSSSSFIAHLTRSYSFPF